MSPEEKDYILHRLAVLEKEQSKSSDEIQSLREYLNSNKDLPESWESLEKIDGYYIDSFSKIEKYQSRPTNEENKNVFACKNSAHAVLAQAQLSQLLKAYGNGWNALLPNYVIFPEWRDDCFNPVICQSFFPNLLAFRSKEKATLFYEKHQNLIQQYWSQYVQDEPDNHEIL
ncbi:MAG: hypothetical protein ACK4UK_04225 [Flavobacterium sp.]